MSDLAVAEFHVVLSRKVKTNSMDAAAANRARLLFDQHLETGLYHRIAITPLHLAGVSRLAERVPMLLRTLDALHLSIASHAGVTSLATFDRRLAEAARHEGLTVVP